MRYKNLILTLTLTCMAESPKFVHLKANRGQGAISWSMGDRCTLDVQKLPITVTDGHFRPNRK